jgi:hypothetical protein
MGFFSSETHDNDTGHGGRGLRRHKPHSAKGWVATRNDDAPTKTTAEPGGFFATGRKKKSE